MKRPLIVFTVLAFGFLSCDDIIEVVDISEQTVYVLAPTDGVALYDDTVTFTWDAVDDAESYNIQIATPDFETATQIVTDSTVTTTFFNRSLNSGSYEWRVRAENSGYATAYTVQKFALTANPVDITNEQLVILAPTEGQTFLTTDTINFSWEAIDGANGYVVQIATPDFDNPVEILKNQTTTSTSFSVTDLSSNQYKFRVKAINSGFETGYAEVGFTVNE